MLVGGRQASRAVGDDVMQAQWQCEKEDLVQLSVARCKLFII